MAAIRLHIPVRGDEMLFGKKKAKPQTGSATDLYLVHMFEEMLAERLGFPVFVTQYKLTYGEIKNTKGRIVSHRRFANAMRHVDVEVFFTSIMAPVVHGREGIMPNLPQAHIHFLLTSETNGWYLWDVAEINAHVMHWPEHHEFQLDRYFYEHPTDQASGSLQAISRLLRDQSPRKATYSLD